MLPLQKCYMNHLDFLSENDEFCVFGAGAGGVRIVDQLRILDKGVSLILDNSLEKSGTEMRGVPVALPCSKNVNENPVILASEWYSEILPQLDSLGCKKYSNFSILGLGKDTVGLYAVSEINWLHNRLADDISRDELTHISNYLDGLQTKRSLSSYEQYHHPAISLKKGDVVIDGGAFDAMSTLALLTHHNTNLDIHCFEPEPQNIIQCERAIFKHDKNRCITLIPKGLWSEKNTFSFTSSDKTNAAGSRIGDQGDIKIDVTDIDSYCNKYSLSPRLIKMDIEGAEYQALIGASDTIKKCAPYLAICLYHDFDDLWRIPRLIDSLVPDYHMHIGHHSETWYETVLYCIPRTN